MPGFPNRCLYHLEIMTVSDTLLPVRSEKVGTVLPESEGHFPGLTTVRNFLFLSGCTVGALTVPRDGSLLLFALSALARSLLQGGVLTSCGFGTKVSAQSRQGAGWAPRLQTPGRFSVVASVSAPADLNFRVSRALPGKPVESLLFGMGWHTGFCPLCV